MDADLEGLPDNSISFFGNLTCLHTLNKWSGTDEIIWKHTFHLIVDFSSIEVEEGDCYKG